MTSGADARIYLDDFRPGQKYLSARLRVDADSIKAFASAFDPQPFHLDEGAARASFFNGLSASGWHTAAMTMRLLVESGFRPAGGNHRNPRRGAALAARGASG